MNGIPILYVEAISHIPLRRYLEIVSTMKIIATLVFAACLVSGLAVSADADDRLVLVGASYGNNVLAICESDGTVLWKHNTAGPQKGHTGHHDVHLLPSGNILFHDSWTKTQEITLGKEVVWEYDSATMNGNEGKKVDVHAFDRLSNGETVIVESNVGRIIHVDKDGKLVKQIPLGEGGRKRTRLMRILDNGHYLACAENPGVVSEYDADGNVVWEYEIGTRVFGAIRLKNGNTMICSGSGNSVVEVTPEKQVVWEISKTIPDSDISLGWMTALQELKNGNYIIGNCHAGENNPQIFEIDRNKKVGWEFDEWELVGNGLAVWQVFEGRQAKRLRKQLAKLKK